MNKWIRKLVVGSGMFLLAVTASYAWYFQAAVFAEPLSFAQTRATLPPGLTDSPGNHLQGLRGIIAWHPYCGFAAQYRDGWDSDLPVLMLLAAEDHTTAPEPCIDVAKQQASREKPVNWNMYPGVDHGFAVQADWVRVYAPDIHQQALQAQYEFLARYSQ